MNDLLTFKQLADRRLRRWMIGLGFGVIFALMFALWAKPLYRAGKAWRARQLAAQAEEFITAEKWTEAGQKAQAGYQLKPDEPDTIRAVARLQSLTGQATEAIPFWDQLRLSGKNTPADDQLYAEDLLRVGSIPEAEEEVNRLLLNEPNNAISLRLSAQIALAKREYDKSLKLALQAEKIDPDNKEGQLLIGLLKSAGPEEAGRKEGRTILLQVSEDRTKSGLQALAALGGRSDLSPEEATKVVALIRAHPLALEPHRLMALGLEISLKPTDIEIVLDREITAYQKGTPEAQRAFAVWLNTRKEHERALTLIPLTAAMERKDLLLVHLDALASLKRWGEIEKILLTPNLPLDEAYKEVFLARSAIEKGEPGQAKVHWSRAQMAATLSIEQQWYLATYAEKVGQLREAEQGYRTLISKVDTPRRAYEGLLRIADRSRDTFATRDVLKDMRRRWPDDLGVENDYTYYTLLLELEIERCLKSAKKLVQESPTSLPHRTTLALAHLRSNNPSAALAVYANVKIPWEQFPACHRAVYAAVLAGNGRLEDAHLHVDAIGATVLRLEERALISKLPKK